MERKTGFGKYVLRFVVVLILFVNADMVDTACISSRNYKIPTKVISCGGGNANLTNYSIGHSTGQFTATIGESVSTNYKNQAGYWYTFYGLGDADSDRDGILDDGDTSGTTGDYSCRGGNTINCDDNCMNAANTNQADTDTDGIGDMCDPCISDPELSCGGDTDGDGMADSFEILYHLNPDNPLDAGYDNDGDMLNNIQEYHLLTNPLKNDTDGDGITDNADTCLTYPPALTGSAYYASLQNSYNSSIDASTIQSQAVTLAESPYFNLNKTVTLIGGYNCGYTSITGKTVINGNLTINSGIVFIENYILH